MSSLNILNYIDPMYWILIFGVLIFISMKLYPAVGKKLQKLSLNLFNSSLVIYYFFFLGTVIHELSHFFTCLLLGVKVKKVVLFYPKREENSDYYRLGYVEHASVGTFRSTLVGIAPAIVCDLFTLLVFVWATKDFLLLQSLNLNSLMGALQWMISHPFNWKNYVFLYFAIACALSGEPSGEDLKSVPKTAKILILGSIILYLTNKYIFYFDISKVFFDFLNFSAPLFMGLSFIVFFEVVILVFLYLLFRFVFRIR